jgi:hypothetical protein
MIRQHIVRAFERWAGRDHTPNIGLQRGVCQVTFVTEDSTFEPEASTITHPPWRKRS